METKTPTSTILGVPRKQDDRKTLDLLDLLSTSLGYTEGILLGQVNDVLDLAIRTIRDHAALVKDLAEIVGPAAQTMTPLGMIQQIRADRVLQAVKSIQIPEHVNCRDFDRHLYGPPPIETGIAFSTFLAELVEFQADADLPTDLPSILRKAGEELGEFGEAVANYQDNSLASWSKRPVREEAADLVVVGVRALLKTGGLGDVVETLLDNLRRKAEKYRRGENRIGGRP